MTHLMHAVPAVRVGRDNRQDWMFQVRPESWMYSGLCAQSDPDAWFPDKGGDVGPAKRICARCPVVAECLAFALEHEEAGVWGGTSEVERRRMRTRVVRHSQAFFVERAARIRAMAAAGVAVEEIAERLGMQVSGVRSLLGKDRRWAAREAVAS